MAPSTKQRKICKQRCDRTRKSSRFGKALRRSAATSLFAGSTMRNRRRRASAGSNAPVRNCAKENGGPAAGRAASIAPTRLRARGNRPCLWRSGGGGAERGLPTIWWPLDCLGGWLKSGHLIGIVSPKLFLGAGHPIAARHGPLDVIGSPEVRHNRRQPTQEFGFAKGRNGSGR